MTPHHPNEMTVLAKSKPEPGLWMETRPVPEIGPDDVLIKVHKTGICGTDIHIWNWDAWAQKTVPVPLVTGHEFAGEIVEIGAVVAVNGFLNRWNSTMAPQLEREPLEFAKTHLAAHGWKAGKHER